MQDNTIQITKPQENQIKPSILDILQIIQL